MTEEYTPQTHADQQRAHWMSWHESCGTIYVTGPQRSGTRIAAKMIADVTGRLYVDETQFDAHDMEKFRALRAPQYPAIVVQCPTMLRWIASLAHAIQGQKPNLVVMMMRDLPDIYASEARIGWQWESHEMAKFVSGRPMFRNAVQPASDDPDEVQVIGQPGVVSPTTQGDEPRSAEVKYWFWQQVIKPDIVRNYRESLHAVEVSYEGLAWHPLWRAKERRVGFEWNQTG